MIIGQKHHILAIRLIWGGAHTSLRLNFDIIALLVSSIWMHWAIDDKYVFTNNELLVIKIGAKIKKVGILPFLGSQ